MRTGRTDAKRLIDWVKTTPKWPKYNVHGALITTEQGDGKTFCCNQPNECCDSHTARLAAVEAFYAWRTGDADVNVKQQAYRSYQLGDVLAGSAGERACAVQQSVVVYGRVYRRPAAHDGCVLGFSRVGA